MLHSSRLPFASDIVIQARRYAQAISFSVTAAQKAYTIAEEVLSLVQYFPTSTPAEHHDYLVDMLRLAREGKDAVTRTLNTFKDVRGDVLEVCSLCYIMLLSSRVTYYFSSWRMLERNLNGKARVSLLMSMANVCLSHYVYVSRAHGFWKL